MVHFIVIMKHHSGVMEIKVPSIRTSLDLGTYHKAV